MSTTSVQNDFHAADTDSVPNPLFPLPRPNGQLQLLPLRYRWEVTRRHPYYIEWWKVPFDQDDTDRTPLEHLTSNSAFALLVQIGVSATGINPSTEFSDFDHHQPIQAWQCEGIQLQTFRTLAGILIGQMSPSLRTKVGRLLIESAVSDIAKVNSLFELMSIQDEDIHRFTGEPIVRVSPHLSVKALTEQLTQFLNAWRGEDVPERRIREDKYDEYFQVWDMREGWSQGAYTGDRANSLAEVARSLGISISTANNRYCSAFQLITGHPYTLANWIRVFGQHFWSYEAVGALISAALRRRAGLPRASGSVPIPESMIANHSNSQQLTSSLAVDGETGDWEILEDIKTLIRKGRSDQEIADELELNHPEIVRDIRDHMPPDM